MWHFFSLSLLLLLLPDHAMGIDSLLRLLKEQYPDWEPNAVVDIGANIGEWSQRVRLHFPNTKILLLEATPTHEPALQARCLELGNAEHRIAVLAGTTGDTVEFFQDGNTGNSMFRENTHHFRNSVSVTRTTVRLDDVVRQSPLLGSEPAIDYIKADVQGAELVVLEGGGAILDGASFVQLEISITAFNAGGACFYQVDEFLRSRGFYLYEMAEFFRGTADFGSLGLNQFDALYVNPSSPRLPPKFKELNGQYCGMHPPALARKEPNPALTTTPDAVSIEDLYRFFQATQDAHGITIGTVLLLLFVFLAGVFYGSKRAPKPRSSSRY